ncbi:hypothetical protein T4B_14489, partial [Trichinella pseudospiralis]
LNMSMRHKFSRKIRPLRRASSAELYFFLNIFKNESNLSFTAFPLPNLRGAVFFFFVVQPIKYVSRRCLILTRLSAKNCLVKIVHVFISFLLFLICCTT